ncbi:MAG: hypothetical protein IJ644_04350 [Oscillospiraceae bacterium]|nr:hypothetical protein [Oscillospiraceae bacterium]
MSEEKTNEKTSRMIDDDSISTLMFSRIYISPYAYEHPFKTFDEFEKLQQENSHPEDEKTAR